MFQSFAWFPRGVLWISNDRDDNGGKNQNPKNSLDQNLTPKKHHAEFPSHKNFQKALNDKTRKIETLVLNTPQNPTYIKLPKKYIIFQPPQKNSRNQKFQTPKNPWIITVTRNPEYPPGLGPTQPPTSLCATKR